ncbi:hypothetical protein VHUM_02454 [Vanrija humicola]|uniref:SUN domain-containing protein n=1 Tax=Vanrija humicola TaxID=5417 RepID=A0A7D8YZE1_VANHU|nr:hypothetical protein VHUM_02454 [Vanrija humicola]
MRPPLPLHLVHLILAFTASASQDVFVPNPTSPTLRGVGRLDNNWTRLSPDPFERGGISVIEPWGWFHQQCPAHITRSDLPPPWVRADPAAVDAALRLEEQLADSGQEPTEEAGDDDDDDEDEEEEFESFEEWKRRKEAEEEDDDDEYCEPEDDAQSEGADEGASLPRSRDTTNDSEALAKTDAAPPSIPVEINSSTLGSTAAPGPNTPPAGGTDSKPLPLPHRYNYASPDCSARVLSSSPQTQHASSILHKSRDRYMLTPCRAQQHYVVVELCDEIRIEAMELAVWEFFSGVVREIRLSVGDEEAGDGPGAWTEVATFVGKNVRGVQSFQLSEPTSFHRFVRLDFPSFYGTEYYCPVSQLKVYGMNQMDAFKMEQKRLVAARGAREQEKARERELQREREREAEATQSRERDLKEREDDERRERELCELEKLVQEQARRMSGEALFSPEASVDCSVPSQAAAVVLSQPPASDDNNDIKPPSPPQAAENAEPNGGAVVAPSSPNSDKTAAAAPSDSSESIYAFIIRRLTALEGNSTLVARYIDEHGKALRTSLARAEKRWETAQARAVEDDAHRWEMERMRQEERLGRIVTTVERMKASMDSERRVVESHLRALHDELGYERRRSLVQLIIIIIIIGVGVATKSETIDELLRSLAEVRRRGATMEPRARHQKRLSTGPLAGIVIDVPTPSSSRDHSQPMSPAITPTVNASQQTAQLRFPSGSRSRGTPSLSRSSSLRRAENVSGSSSQSLHHHHHRRRLATRSVTIADPSTIVSAWDFADDEDAQSLVVPQTMTPTPNSRSRLSLHSRTTTGSGRRLARSSHLHAMRSRRGDESSDAEAGDGPSPNSSSSLASPVALVNGRAVRGNSPRLVRPARNDEHDDSQWGTEDGLSGDVASTSGSASASEVDDEAGGTMRRISPLAHRSADRTAAGSLSALGFQDDGPPEYNHTSTTETQPIPIRVPDDTKHNDTLHAHSL